MRFADVFQQGIAGALTGFNVGQAMKSGDAGEITQSILGGLAGNAINGLPGGGMGLPGMAMPGLGTNNQLGALGYALGGLLSGKQKNNPLFGGRTAEIIEGGAPKKEDKEGDFQQLPYPTYTTKDYDFGQTPGYTDFDGNYNPRGWSKEDIDELNRRFPLIRPTNITPTNFGLLS